MENFTKLSIKRLPPGLLECDFYSTIENYKEDILKYYFMKGKDRYIIRKIRVNQRIYSQAFIVFKTV
jgi:hypothetical protein